MVIAGDPDVEGHPPDGPGAAGPPAGGPGAALLPKSTPTALAAPPIGPRGPGSTLPAPPLPGPGPPRHQPMPRTRPHVLPLLGGIAALTLTAGCGGSDPSSPGSTGSGSGGRADLAAGSASFRRLELTPTGAGEPGEVEVRQQIAIPEELPGNWKLRAETHSVKRVDKLGTFEDFSLLWLENDTPIRVGLPGPFDPGVFNQVAVTIVAPGETDVFLAPRRIGEKDNVFRTEQKRVKGKKVPQTILFDLPLVRRETKAFDELGVIINCRRKQAGLVAVDLLYKPWDLWLPDPAGDAELVEIGLEARRAEALTSERPVTTRVTATEGSELVVPYGIPDHLRQGGQRPALRVSVTSDGEEVRGERLELESDLTVPSRWHEARIALGDLAGKELEVQFSLDAGGEGLALCALGQPALVTRSADAPTVVLVTSDTHRADHLGCANMGVEVATPFLDALAERGVLFEDVVTATNVTNPSHIALMTGTHLRDTGIVNNYTALADAAPTLAEAFQAAGYTTASLVCANHLAFQRSGLGQGFDRTTSPTTPQRDSLEVIEELEGWLPQVDGLPVFIWLHVFDAHAPYQPPAEFREPYYAPDRDPADAELPDPDPRAVPKWLPNVRDLDFLVAQYKAEVSYLDRNLQRVLDLPRFREGIIAVTADHGESLISPHVFWDHRELYPDTLFVPLILAWPDAPAGKRISSPVEQIDVARTLLDLAGIEAPGFPGQNLTEAENAPVEPRFAISASALSSSIQLGKWFLVLHLRDHRVGPMMEREQYEVELYDIEDDIECRNNLVDDEPERAKRLRQMLIDWLLEARPDGWATATGGVQDKAAMDALAEMGYTTDGAEPSGNSWFDPEFVSPWTERFQ